MFHRSSFILLSFLKVTPGDGDLKTNNTAAA
jgi:hypothetical protein